MHFIARLFHQRQFSLSACLAASVLVIVPAARAQIVPAFYVTNSGNNTIEKFLPDGTASVFASGGLLNNPTGIAMDDGGDLFVANAGNNTLVEFPAGGGSFVVASTGLSSPQGVTVVNNTTIYVANAGNNTIEQFTYAGAGSVYLSSGVFQPFGLTYGTGPLGSSQFYIGNQGASDILSGWSGSVWLNTGTTVVTGMAIDRNGFVYLADQNTNQIQKLNNGATGGVFVSTGLNAPGGLTFDDAGNLYAINSGNNTISKITPGGAVSVFASSGLNNPIFIAFGPPIPEPASSAALIGIAAFGFILRFRRRVRSSATV